ncbi:MAG: hypothetical protein J6X69_00960 [Bacteroidales bacterium]|nr:hypothetical protein [Bacteroidales bacterium]
MNRYLLCFLLLSALLPLSCKKATAERESAEPQQPQVRFGREAGSFSVTVDEAIVFEAVILSSGPVSCEWKVDGEKVASTPSMRYPFKAVGTYAVSFRAYNAVGEVSRDWTVQVNGIPLVISFTPEEESLSCVMKETLAFKATVRGGDKGVEHRWSLAEEVLSTTAELQYTPQTAGTTVISYKGTNTDGFSVTRSWTVVAGELPLEIELSNPSAQIVGRVGEAISLTATVLNGGAGIVHAWTLDGAADGSEASWTHTFEATGVHTLRYEAVNAKQERFSHDWTLYIQKADTRPSYLYADFENGLPSNFTGNAGALKVIANPHHGLGNPSAKVLSDDMHSSTSSTSGYVQINPIASFEGKAESSVIRVKIWLGKAAYYPYLQLIRDSNPRHLPSRINGSDFTGGNRTQAHWEELILRDDWNVLEYDIREYGLTTCADVVQLQLRPFSKWNGNNIDAGAASETNPRLVYYDDIEFVINTSGNE